jgi:PAS domain S-box-containing protein
MQSAYAKRRSAELSFMVVDSPRRAQPDFLSGGGQMGVLIHAFDWSKTAIGPPENWSTALRTVLRVLLVNRFPMLLWWGPEYVQFYNDAYLPIPGAKHPASLGQRGRECWSEIWDVLRPLIDTPFNGGAATWIEDIELQINRAGFAEETHFTIAYSPVPDETAEGGVGGVLATVHEITAKVVNERRTAILRDLGAHAAEARTAEEACATAAATLSRYTKDIPYALLYLTDPDGRNASLAASFGLDEAPGLAPAAIRLAESTGQCPWPLGAAQRTEEMQVVTNPDRAPTAVIAPIRSNVAHQLSGFLVGGLSPHLKLDEAYRNFLELATSQIAIAIASARAYETERRRAEALAEIDRAKTAFFSNVSHEFRTPLTLMLGPLESLLAKGETLSRNDREEIATAHRNSLRLLKLVNSLLDFARIEAGRIKASYRPVDLAVLTTDLASNFRSVLQAAGLDLIIDCPPLPQSVYVDTDMWEKIVLNLLSNAFKFTLQGSVTVRLRAAENHARLTVADTGVGIAEAELPKIFERFHRVEGNAGRTYEGTGIGLALLQELVKLHGGTVEVSSRPGEGSAFTVSIPLGTAHLPEEHLDLAASNQSAPAIWKEAFTGEAVTWLARERLTQPDQDLPLESPAEPGPGHRPGILLADDNADMREHVSHILSSKYDIITASDGREALAKARRRKPDLILSDVMMPGLDGFAFMRELREDVALREIPVILLSARAGEEARTEGIQSGADDYLTKPFSARELVARVQTTLELQRVRHNAREQFKTLLNQAPMGVYLVDADFRVAQANPTALRAFGDIPDIVGRDFSEVIHLLRPQEYADEIVRHFRHTLETGEPYVVPERILQRREGKIAEYYEWRIDRIPLPDGRNGVVCYFRDISAQVLARQEIAISEEKLRFRAEELETLIDATPAFVFFAHDAECKRITGNWAVNQLFGVPAGTNLSVTLAAEELPMQKAAASGQTINDGEFEFRFPDGRRVHVIGSAAPLFDGEGKVRGCIGAFLDVTARKRTEEALQRANEDLKQFAFAASHDLQEPLRMVTSYSQLLVSGFRGQLDAEAALCVDFIGRGTGRMRELLSDLLNYTQLSVEEQTQAELVDLNSVFQKAVENLRSSMEESHATIRCGHLPAVRGHEAHFLQLFQNLLGNSIKYRGPKTPEIDISSSREGCHWRVSVADNGIGIEPEYHEKVFGVFKRLHGKKIPGTGIGLAICQRVVERYGGRIWVESQLNEGATFHFTLVAQEEAGNP